MMVQGTFARLLAPGLNELFNTAYAEAPEVWTNLFNLNTSSRAFEEDMSWAGFEPPQEIGELEQVPLRDAKPGFVTRYVHRKRGLGYQLSRELVDDNLYGNISEFPAQLARAFRAGKEVIAASIFNLGFNATVVGGDGQPLFSTAHPLAGAAGGVQANTAGTPTALSHAALKDALIRMKRTRADDGIFSPIQPSILLVPDQLVYTAKEILGTTQIPYSADNTINVLAQESLQIVPWSYLTSEDSWFLLAPKAQTKLKYWERWALDQIMKDIDENQSMMHMGFERYSFGWSDFRGLYGNRGS